MILQVKQEKTSCPGICTFNHACYYIFTPLYGGNCYKNYHKTLDYLTYEVKRV